MVKVQKKLVGPFSVLVNSSLPALAAEMKSAELDSGVIYHDLCRATFFYTRWTEKMIKRHNSYLYLFKILRG